MKKKSRARIFKLLQMIVCVLPLIVLIIINWDVYTETPASTVSLGFGMAVTIVSSILKLLNKMPKNIKAVVWAGIVCALSWCLKLLIVDLPIIATAWFIGSLLGEIFTPIIKKYEREGNIEDTATATANEVAEKISNIIGGGGRV